MATEKKQDIPVKSESPLMHPLLEIEKAFDRLVGNGWPISWHLRDIPMSMDAFTFEGSRAPKLDVIDREKEIIVRAEVPGINKKDIDVSLNENLLTIKGKTSSEKKEEKGDYHRHEISSSSFARSVTLPSSVTESKITASLKDGVLEVTLPKNGSSKKKSITVK
jgi:HSP20 family protein